MTHIIKYSIYSPSYVWLKFNLFNIDDVETNLKKTLSYGLTLLGIKENKHTTLFLHLSLMDLKRYIEKHQVFELPLPDNHRVISTCILSCCQYHQFENIKDILNYINQIEEKMTPEERLMDFLARPLTNINNLEPFYDSNND